MDGGEGADVGRQAIRAQQRPEGKLRRHGAATRELAATQRARGGPTAGEGAGPRVWGLLGFMFPLQRSPGAQSLEEEWISLCRALASPSFLLHSADNPVLARKPTQRAFLVSSPPSLEAVPRPAASAWTQSSRSCPVPAHPTLFQASEESLPASALRSGATRRAGGTLAACGMQLATSHSHCGPRTQPTTATPSTSSSAGRPRPLCPLQVGRELLSSRPHAQEDVQARLQGLSVAEWEGLRRKVAGVGSSSSRFGSKTSSCGCYRWAQEERSGGSPNEQEGLNRQERKWGEEESGALC